MTMAIDRVFDHVVETLDPRKVCAGCRDKTKCEGCGFNRNRPGRELTKEPERRRE